MHTWLSQPGSVASTNTVEFILTATHLIRHIVNNKALGCMQQQLSGLLFTMCLIRWLIDASLRFKSFAQTSTEPACCNLNFECNFGLQVLLQFVLFPSVTCLTSVSVYIYISVCEVPLEYIFYLCSACSSEQLE